MRPAAEEVADGYAEGHLECGEACDPSTELDHVRTLDRVPDATVTLRAVKRAPATLLVVAVLVAGCGGGHDGGGSLADFKQGYVPVNRDLLRLGSDVGIALRRARSDTDANIATTFGSFAGRMEAIRMRLDALDPPKRLEKQQMALSVAMVKLNGDLSEIAAAAAKHDAAVAKAATRALVQDSPALAAPRRALAAATGAAVGP